MVGVRSLRAMQLCTLRGWRSPTYDCPRSGVGKQAAGRVPAGLPRRASLTSTLAGQRLFSHRGAEIICRKRTALLRCSGSVPWPGALPGWASSACLLRDFAFPTSGRGSSLTLRDPLFRINAHLLVAPSVAEIMVQL